MLIMWYLFVNVLSKNFLGTYLYLLYDSFYLSHVSLQKNKKHKHPSHPKHTLTHTHIKKNINTKTTSILLIEYNKISFLSTSNVIPVLLYTYTVSTSCIKIPQAWRRRKYQLDLQICCSRQ